MTTPLPTMLCFILVIERGKSVPSYQGARHLSWPVLDAALHMGGCKYVLYPPHSPLDTFQSEELFYTTCHILGWLPNIDHENCCRKYLSCGELCLQNKHHFYSNLSDSMEKGRKQTSPTRCI